MALTPQELRQSSDRVRTFWSSGLRAGIEGVGAGAAPPGPPAPLGLSLAHKCPQTGLEPQKLGFGCSQLFLFSPPAVGNPSSVISVPAPPPVVHPRGTGLVDIYRGGRCVRIRQVGDKRPSRVGGNARGVCRGFSRSSRLNMLETINRVDRTKVAGTIFVTLTAPAGDMDWARVERNRRAWLKRLDRRWGHLRYFVIWKKEPHNRRDASACNDQPHLHALIFFLDAIPDVVGEFRPWNDLAWAEVVNSEKFEANLKYGCRTEFMRSWNGVAYYCSKYMSKESEHSQSETGRVWGVHRRQLVPLDLRAEVIPPDAAKRVARTLRKLRQRRSQVFEVFSKSDDRWIRIYPDRSKGVFRRTSEQVYDDMRSIGLRVRRRRPRALRTREITIWGQAEDSESGKREILPLGVEKHSYSCGLHFIDPAEVERLVSFEVRASLDRLIECDEPPF